MRGTVSQAEPRREIRALHVRRNEASLLSQFIERGHSACASRVLVLASKEWDELTERHDTHPKVDSMIRRDDVEGINNCETRKRPFFRNDRFADGEDLARVKAHALRLLREFAKGAQPSRCAVIDRSTRRSPEGKKPAFVDDLVGLLLGPMFVTADVGFALGLRLEVKSGIEQIAGPTRLRPMGELTTK